MADEDPYLLLAEDDGANGEEDDIENEDDDDDDDDDNSEGDDMDDSGEDNDDEESGNDEDDDDDEEKMKNIEIFIRTFHNGNYDIQFEAALSLDRSGIEPDMHTQALYNKPDNWRERNRIGLEKVKEQLQSCIHSVSYDKTVNLKLIHNDQWYQLGDNEEPIVWHEQILDEYWDQLEAKIKQLGIVTDIRDIQIENVEITKERLATLVTALSGQVSTIEYIHFINVNLCQEGITWLLKLVDACSQLQTLFIHHNRIDNMDSARCLSRSLLSHACIEDLHLANCDLGGNPEILLVILQSDVKYIYINNNNIDSLGAVIIAEYLESDPPIHSIDLSHNRLNDEDAVLISQALKRNTNLRQIDFRLNNFTSIGVKALLTCFFDSTSLNAISESNHTLDRMILFSMRETDNKLDYCMFRLLLMDRIEKILLALQDKNSLLQYLASVPVGLIPEVLALPRWNVSEHQHLSIMYYTMRWWNMPLLYSYQNCSDNMMSDRKRNRDN
jgi:hypothetical protein